LTSAFNIPIPVRVVYKGFISILNNGFDRKLPKILRKNTNGNYLFKDRDTHVLIETNNSVAILKTINVFILFRH